MSVSSGHDVDILLTAVRALLLPEVRRPCQGRVRRRGRRVPDYHNRVGAHVLACALLCCWRACCLFSVRFSLRLAMAAILRRPLAVLRAGASAGRGSVGLRWAGARG